MTFMRFNKKVNKIFIRKIAFKKAHKLKNKDTFEDMNNGVFKIKVSIYEFVVRRRKKQTFPSIFLADDWWESYKNKDELHFSFCIIRRKLNIIFISLDTRFGEQYMVLTISKKPLFICCVTKIQISYQLNWNSRILLSILRQ